jgi:toxin ParE1/3/4
VAYEVLLTADAEKDLGELYTHLSEHDSPEKANRVLRRIEIAFSGLSNLPDRGAWPKELSALGIREYREVFFKPYRIVYRVLGETVYVLLITDGRRAMQTLLQRRLFSAT